MLGHMLWPQIFEFPPLTEQQLMSEQIHVPWHEPISS